MNALLRFSVMAVVLLMLMSQLTGCSDSDDETSDVSGGGILSGTVATGEAFVGVLNITGSGGEQILNGSIASDGSFSVDIESLTEPFVLQAVPTDTTQATLYSFASSVNETVNVTPLTNLAMYIANASSDPATLFSSWLTSSLTFVQQALREAQAVINANLANIFLLNNVDATAYDFFRTIFSTNSSGIDAVLDAITVDLSNGVNVSVSGDAGFSFDSGIDTSTIDIGGTPSARYSVNGTVNDATGALTLRINGTLLNVSLTSFSFEQLLLNGAAYNVQVETQPTGQTCTVSNGVGTINNQDIGGVLVTCQTDGGGAIYTVSGSVSGLTGMLSLQLRYKFATLTEDLADVQGSTFAFAAELDDGYSYVVDITAQPVGQTCSVSDAAGFINGADVSNVSINCSDNNNGGSGNATSASLSVNPAQYFDFSTGIASDSNVDADTMGVNNEGVNFGNEGDISIPGHRVMLLTDSGSLSAFPAIPEWTEATPWVSVSYDFSDGTQGQPVAVGEVWAVYTREGNYAVMEITGLPGGGFGNSFTFDYLYNADGSRNF